MIDLVAGLLAGIAAHQTDHIVKDWPSQWEMLSRYVIGGLTVIMSFVLIMSHLNRATLRDSLLALCGAFASVGVGVAVGRWFDGAIK